MRISRVIFFNAFQQYEIRYSSNKAVTASDVWYSAADFTDILGLKEERILILVKELMR